MPALPSTPFDAFDVFVAAAHDGPRVMDPDLTSFNLSHSIYRHIVDRAQEDPQLLPSLYRNPHSARAIFRALPPVARLYVARLLYIPPGEPYPTLDVFQAALRRRQRARDRHDAAVRALLKLQILVEYSEQDGLRLHDVFAKSIRQTVSNRIPPVFRGAIASNDTMSVQNMIRFSSGQLERILNYLVESSTHNIPSKNVIQSLIHANILRNAREGLVISSPGFQFLLQDTFSQLWVLIRAVLSCLFYDDTLDCLNLLFEMSCATAGRLYSLEVVNEVQRQFLDILMEFGIVVVEETGFRPMFVAVRLLAAGSRSSEETNTLTKSAGEIEIFVETNFRVYAYTNSQFQMNLLGLFTLLRYRLPNMVVGHLTRTAVRQALQNGINGTQIIGYLNTHAHPRMRKGMIPANVADEIRLWEAEQDRVRMVPGVLLGEFRSDDGYETVFNYANQRGAILWVDNSGRRFIVDSKASDSVLKFIRENRIQ